MKVVAVVLLGQLALALSLPLFDDAGTKASVYTNTHLTPAGRDSTAQAEASARLSRGATSQASSEVGLDGKTKSAALASRTPDQIALHPGQSDFLREGPGGLVPSGDIQPSGPGGSPPAGGFVPPPQTGPGAVPSQPSGPGIVPPPQSGPGFAPPPQSGPGAVPSQPSGPGIVPPKTGTTKIQKVTATASKVDGTAIASASRKRDVRDTSQHVSASGDTAISSAKDASSFGNTQQIVKSQGGRLATATAESGPKAPVFTRDVATDKNVQIVKAKGDTAVSSAKNKKDSATNVQSVKAEGGKLAVATASSGDDSSSPQVMSPEYLKISEHPAGPAPGPAPIPESQGPPAKRDLGQEGPVGPPPPTAGPGPIGPGGPIGNEPGPPPNVPLTPNKTVQSVHASGNTAISKGSSISKGPVDSTQHITASGSKLAVATAEAA